MNRHRNVVLSGGVDVAVSETTYERRSGIFSGKNVDNSQKTASSWKGIQNIVLHNSGYTITLTMQWHQLVAFDLKSDSESDTQSKRTVRCVFDFIAR